MTRVKKPVLSFEKLIIAGVNELVIGGQMLSSDRKHSLLSIIARTGAEEQARGGNVENVVTEDVVTGLVVVEVVWR